VRRFLFITVMSLVVLTSPSHADDAGELLRSVASGYEAIKTYEFKGTETVVLPGMDCTIVTPISIAVADPALNGGISFGRGPKPTKACFDAVTKIGSLPMPGTWSNFRSMEVGVLSARILATQTLNLAGSNIPCIVLEVLYDDYYRKLRNYDGPLRYWIDEKTHLIRRVEFGEKSLQGPRAWTATIETVSIGDPAPPWLAPASVANSQTLDRLGALIGKPAPDFELPAIGGGSVHLASLRGKVIVLDFWATWCGSCLEEIPQLEKLQAEASPAKMVILGVSDEDPSVVEKWREEYKRSFRTLAGGQKVFKDFGVGPIPALVVIDPQGIVVKYQVGFSSERQLRSWVEGIASN
jgi:peroxiredoxin